MSTEIAKIQGRDVSRIASPVELRKIRDGAELARKYVKSLVDKIDCSEIMFHVVLRSGEVYEQAREERGAERDKGGRYHSSSQLTNGTSKQQVRDQLGQSRETLRKWVDMTKASDHYEKASEYCQKCKGSLTPATMSGLYQYLCNIHFSFDSPEWLTPKEILDMVVEVFGKIDLDPCADEGENVPAEHHFTYGGLGIDWFGKVYMNPPYGNELPKWVQKMCHEYDEDNIDAGLVLVPSRTDTEWFYELRDYPRCFIKGRLKFSDSENSAPFPSMVVYLGNDAKRFIDVFRGRGDIYARV